jgi:sugar phosphate isomerase/epimerase
MLVDRRDPAERARPCGSFRERSAHSCGGSSRGLQKGSVNVVTWGEYDIRIAIHNHGAEDKMWHSPLDVLKAVSSLDPRIGCCIDVGHLARAGTDVVQAIHEVGPRLFNVHMKDLTNFQSKESQVAVGDGIMPVRGIFDALIATKYKGFVDLEYEVHADDPMPGVISSFAYMRGVLAGIGYKTHA